MVHVDPARDQGVALGGESWASVGQREYPTSIPPPNSVDPHLGLQVRLHDGPDSAWKWSLSLENLLGRLYWDVEHAVLGMEFARFFGLGLRHWDNVYAPRR